MEAKPNTTYAIINNNQVTQLFTKEIMPQWNEAFITAVPLTKKQKQWVNIGTLYDENTQSFVEPSLDEIKRDQIAYVNANFEKECESIKGEYVPNDEQLSWSIQEEEAKAYWNSENPKLCPMLATLAKSRGIPLQTLVEKVLEKNTQYRQAIAMLVGNRQALQDRIERAESVEAVRAVEYISPFN